VSQLEDGLLQALFRGYRAAAEYLMAMANAGVTPLHGAREARILWVSRDEVEFFSYMKKVGLRAASEFLLKRAEESEADFVTQYARAMRVKKKAMKEMAERADKCDEPIAIKVKPARKRRCAASATQGGAE
jgi:hypothetical protein